MRIRMRDMHLSKEISAKLFRIVVVAFKAPLVQWSEFMVPNHKARVRFPDGAASEFKGTIGAVGSASVLCTGGPGFESLIVQCSSSLMHSIFFYARPSRYAQKSVVDCNLQKQKEEGSRRPECLEISLPGVGIEHTSDAMWTRVIAPRNVGRDGCL